MKTILSKFDLLNQSYVKYIKVTADMNTVFDKLINKLIR